MKKKSKKVNVKKLTNKVKYYKSNNLTIEKQIIKMERIIDYYCNLY